MELLKPEGAEVLAEYEHYNWKGYAAITRNQYGKGMAYYLGCMTDNATLQNVIKAALGDAGVKLSGYGYPVSFVPSAPSNCLVFSELFCKGAVCCV